MVLMNSFSSPRSGNILWFLVIFYFAQSPFFDKQSNNNSVFLQAISDPRFASWLATRENFEAQLRRIAGTEYVVIHDPIASKTRYKNGELSNIWVIQKQARRKRHGQEDEVTPLAVYYIVGDSIYQAPNIAKLVGNRMVGFCPIVILVVLLLLLMNDDGSCQRLLPWVNCYQ